MKLKKKLFAIIAYLSMMMGAVSLSSTFGWFDNKVTTGEDVYGESAGAYFAYGNGSREKPYGISNKRHLYNLAWLQYLGKFNDRDFYFELADDIDMGGLVLPPIGTTEYPFIGHFSGLSKDSTETTKKCHQISNLVIANTAGQMSSVPEAVKNTDEFKNQNELSNLESIGLFGCIGDIKDYDLDVVGTIQDKETPILHDFKVSNIRLDSKTDSTLAGVVAGYVDGKINNVSVNVSKNVSSSSITIEKGGSTLSLGSKTFPSTSEFTSVGYCESEYQTIQYRSENQVYSPITNEGFTFTAGGTENEWGGSLDMSAFTKRLDALSSNYAITLQPSQYSLEEKTTLDSVGKVYQTTKSYFSGSDFTGYHYYDGNVANNGSYNSLLGAFNAAKTISNSNFYVYYLNAGTRINEEAFKVNMTSGSVQSIGLNGHYLAVSDNNQLISIDSNAFAWCIPFVSNGSGAGKIYAHINKKELYLTIDSNNELNLTETSTDAISWSIGMKDNTYKITYGNYYVDYNSAADRFFLNLKQVKSTSFKIMAKNTDTISASVATGGTQTKERNYYLALNNTADGDKYYFDYQVFDEKGETKNEAKALEWYIGDQVMLTHGNGSYTCYSLYCVIDGIDYYLECAASASENKEFYLTKSPSSNQKSNYFYFNESKGYLVCLYGTNTFRKLRHIQSGASDANWGWCYASNDSSPDTDSTPNDFAICYTGSSNVYSFYPFSTEYSKIQSQMETIENGKYMFSFSTVDFNVSEPYFDYSRDDVTYLPINVDSNYQASESNTGYLVGGTQENDTLYPYGNVRVSDYGSKSNSLGDYEKIKNESQTPLTIIYDGSQYNIAELQKSNYQKYLTAFASFKSSILSDSTSLYGLHFMDANISKDKLITAKKARISKKTSSDTDAKYTDYTDYQLPANSLDFHLQSKGYINFFAGTYGFYTISNNSTVFDNDSFFSLHEIIRESSDATKIKEIREIKTIYRTNEANGGYLYEYVNADSNNNNRLFSTKFTYDSDENRVYENGQNSETLLSYSSSEATEYLKNCTMVFDTTQLGNRNSDLRSQINQSYTQRTFYFEIPVNDGEYALGSVDGGTGAYLMYLDIGSNATRINRTTITEKFTETRYSLAYPNGVTFMADDQSRNFCVSIPKNYKGTLSITYEDNGYNLSLNDASVKPVIRYYEDDTLFSSSTVLDFDKGTQESSSSIIRQTFMDYNTNDGSLTKIIIIDKDGTKTGEYYLNNEKVDKDKINIYIKNGENYVIEEDINNIIFSYDETKGKLIFTFSFVTEENDQIEITYELSLDELQSDSINRYYTDKDYVISFTLDGKEVKITLTKSDGTSSTYTVIVYGTGIRHQP